MAVASAVVLVVAPVVLAAPDTQSFGERPRGHFEDRRDDATLQTVRRRTAAIGALRRRPYSIRETLCCACSSNRLPAIPHHTVSAKVTATASRDAQVHDTGVGSPCGSCMYIATVTRR
jgi:hypothetical protein